MQVLDVHMLMLIACAGAIALGDYSEAATVVVLFSLADFLENRCSGQVRKSTNKLVKMGGEAHERLVEKKRRLGHCMQAMERTGSKQRVPRQGG